MQTIREAKIVIHLEQGKAELKVPDLTRFLADQQRQIDQAKQLEDQLRRVQAAQQALTTVSPQGPMPAPSAPGGQGGGAPGSKEANEQLQRQIELTKQLQEATERLTKALTDAARVVPSGGGRNGPSDDARRVEDHEREVAKLRSSMINLAEATRLTAEGFFRIGRAAVLLGSSNESLHQMVKNLAEVQAYWDLLAGTISIIQGVLAAQKALAAAQASYVAALAASTLATQAFTVALVEAAAALLALLAPIVVIIAVIGAVVIAAIAIWDALTVSEEEAAEAAKAHAEAVQAATQKTLDSLTSQLEMEEQLEAVRRRRMSLDEQQDSLAGSRARSGALASSLAGSSSSVDPAAERQFLEAAREAAMDAVKFGDEELALAIKRRDTEVEIRQEKIRQIESAEKALQTAERQLQIEEEKLRSFQAQVGALSDFERDQLINIRNRLRAGEEINPFEEEFLASKGGEGGRRAADDIRAKRGAAAGFGVDFWEGTAGAGAAKDMADASEKVAKALQDLAKLLEGSDSAAAAKAKYEAQIKAIEAASAKEIEALQKAWDANLKTLEAILDRLMALEEAATKG